MLISDENVKFGLLTGIAFRFHDSDNVIVFTCAPFSGKEVVFLNGAVVSTAKSYSKQSLHEFEAARTRYTIELSSTDASKGHIECTLSRGESVVRSYVLSRSQTRRPTSILTAFLIALPVGFIQSFFGYSLWFTFVILFILGLIAIWLQRGKWSYEIVA